MNRIILTASIVGLLLLSSAAQAQQEFKHKPASSVKRVVMYGIIPDLLVEGYQGAEISIEATKLKPIPEKAKGLKPIGMGGTDNTEVGLYMEEDGEELVFKQAINRVNGTYKVKLPKGISIHIRGNHFNSSKITIENVTEEVEVDGTTSPVELLGITGPIVVNTMGSTVKAVFSALQQDRPISVTSTGGEIDITLPASAKATLDLNSMGGDIYTDLDLKSNREKQSEMDLIGGANFDGTLNGGGVKINLNALGGTIYLRKG